MLHTEGVGDIQTFLWSKHIPQINSKIMLLKEFSSVAQLKELWQANIQDKKSEGTYG